ncbi:GNAT family N-acetyltransferase [Streptomyces tremellae]|uniref:GNAT family N-acetyltransferase n=1 Tax=Streptomyces tremellae TaxID=1124239 RepID=A0ABP7F146_9ACTN
MGAGEWFFTGDIGGFVERVGGFLRSRAALHNTPLTALEKLRARGDGAGTLFGWLEADGEVRGVCYRPPRHLRLTVTPLGVREADGLAGRLAGDGVPLGGVTADHGTATAFAGAWERHTGAAAAPFWRGRLHRLGTLTLPGPPPAGQGRRAGAGDHEHVVGWCDEFLADVGEAPAASWAVSRFADKEFTFWETPDGTPVSMAGSTRMVGGMVRVDPVHTPARLRGRGYAGAVTVEVSRAALAAGARDVVLFTDPANRTSNALYRRVGYVPLAEFTGFAFAGGALQAR